MNIVNVKATMARIESDLERWDQNSWNAEDSLCQFECGTAYCFAGHAEVLATGAEGKSTSATIATADRWLELSADESEYLFSGLRSLSDFRLFIELGRTPTIREMASAYNLMSNAANQENT